MQSVRYHFESFPQNDLLLSILCSGFSPGERGLCVCVCVCGGAGGTGIYVPL